MLRKQEYFSKIQVSIHLSGLLTNLGGGDIMSVVYTILVAIVTILSALLVALYEYWLVGTLRRFKEWFSNEKMG